MSVVVRRYRRCRRLGIGRGQRWHGVRDALDYGVKVTGCTLFVVDDGVDSGPIVAQRPVPVEPDDTADSA